MSATGRTEGLRHPDDFYRTPAWCTRALLQRLGAPLRGIYGTEGRLDRGDVSVIDPCAGDGAILDVCAAVGLKTVGLELDEGRATKGRPRGVICADALKTGQWPRADLLITNPPYSLAMEFVRRGAAGGYAFAAFLLRLPWLASAGRARFHMSNPSTVLVLPRRPEFAASLKCTARRPPKGKVARAEWVACDYAEAMTIADYEAKKPTRCPRCGARLEVNTSDATDYGWFVWGAHATPNRWEILTVEPR